MRTFFIYLFVFSGLLVFAQSPDPMDFFPSAVGNVWEYSGQWGRREEIYKDSIDQNGYRFIFVKFNLFYPAYPYFLIDSTSKEVFYDPTGLNWLYYKLDADTGDHWMVRPETPEVQRLEALVLAKYPFIYLGKQTIFMEIMYFELQRGDTVINENAWPRFREVLAEGFGEIMYIDEEGGGPYKLLQGCIINGDTLGTITSIDENMISVNSFALFQNYPNPFNPTTTIRFALPVESRVKINIYNSLGQLVETLADKDMKAGHHEINFNASRLASGVYFYKLTSGNFVETRKMLLMK
ncbi:MAG: hypothetical protein BroJett005_22260 [Ignavibacteriota bacterium]|nr:MAG: hypothetical protein BroJett005_22260 [Ignavibacteriota bacterium]